MARIIAGDQSFNIEPSIGPSSGSTPIQPVTSFGSATASLAVTLAGASVTLVVLGGAPDAAVVDELVTDLWLLGDFPMRYRLWAVWQDFDSQGDDRVSFQAVTYERLMNRRLFGAGGLLASAVDVGTIVWDAIQHTQAKPGGDLGITAGNIVTGVTTSIDWLPGQNIGSVLEEMMNATNCYWVIDSELQLHVYSRDAAVPIVEPLMWGINVHEMQRASAGVGFANSVFASGSAATVPVFSTHPDIATDPRGLWETAIARPNDFTQAYLQEAADGELAISYLGLSHWNVTYVTEHWIGASRISPGDRAVLVVPSSLAGPASPPPTVNVECVSMTMSFTGDGALEIGAVFNELPAD